MPAEEKKKSATNEKCDLGLRVHREKNMSGLTNKSRYESNKAEKK